MSGSATALSARIEWLESVDSTNSEALRRAENGERGPLWIATADQFGGRGRRGRAWRSAGAALAATLLLEPTRWRPGATAIEIATLSYAAALAVADTLSGLGATAPVTLKWPNDVLLAGAKVSGILLETRGGVLAVGIGINLADAPSLDETAEPQASAATAASAFLPAPETATPQNALALLVERFGVWFEAWRAGGFAALRASWIAQAARFGETVIARLPNETIEGRFVDLDAEGALILETTGGVRRIHAADLYWPAGK